MDHCHDWSSLLNIPHTVDIISSDPGSAPPTPDTIRRTYVYPFSGTIVSFGEHHYFVVTDPINKNNKLYRNLIDNHNQHVL